MVSKRLALCLALCLPIALSHKVGSSGSVANTPINDDEDAVEHAQEALDLRDDIVKLGTELEKAREQYTAVKQYYDAKKAHLTEQIRIRKLMASHHHADGADDATYRSLQEKHYKSGFCSICLKSFVFGGTQEQRTGILEICMGRKNLTFIQATVGDATPAVSEPAVVQPFIPPATVAALDDKVKVLVTKERRLARASFLKRGPEDSMHHQLAEMKAALEDMQTKLNTDRAQWQLEVKNLKEEESELADSYKAQHNIRVDVKETAFAKVKDDLCPSIKANYGVNDAAIPPIIMEECELPNS